MLYGNCPYWDCSNRNELGYCKTTTCINPKYQSNFYYTTTSTSMDSKNQIYYFTDYTTDENN